MFPIGDLIGELIREGRGVATGIFNGPFQKQSFHLHAPGLTDSRRATDSLDHQRLISHRLHEQDKICGVKIEAIGHKLEVDHDDSRIGIGLKYERRFQHLFRVAAMLFLFFSNAIQPSKPIHMRLQKLMHPCQSRRETRKDDGLVGRVRGQVSLQSLPKVIDLTWVLTRVVLGLQMKQSYDPLELGKRGVKIMLKMKILIEENMMAKLNLRKENRRKNLRTHQKFFMFSFILRMIIMKIIIIIMMMYAIFIK